MKYFFIIILAFIVKAFGQQEWLSPDVVIGKLMEGNERFVQDQLNHPRHTLRREATSSSQSPCAVILTCSDSRVPPEIIFDQGVGDLFVVRDAGNVVGPIELDSIEFAAIYLKASLILVLGHENCSAVKAVLEGNTKYIEAIADLIKPAIHESALKNGDQLERAIKSNVRHTVSFLERNSTLRKMIDEGKLKICGGYYDLKTGRVSLIDHKKGTEGSLSEEK